MVSQVVHIVNTTGSYGNKQHHNSYVSLFSGTPGKLTKEVKHIGQGFSCGGDKVVDFVNFFAKYSCWSHEDTEGGWDDSDIPTLRVHSDTNGDERKTKVSIDTKVSKRWSLAINTNEVEDFTLKGMLKRLFL